MAWRPSDWVLTDDEWAQQARQNSEEMTHFMLQLGDAIESPPRDDSDDSSNGLGD
jgi:hypothetical protein